MNDAKIQKDPREGTYDAIWTRIGARGGVWTFEYVGFGNYGFTDATTGDFIPSTAVIFAQRVRDTR